MQRTTRTVDTPHGQFEWKETSYPKDSYRLAAVSRELSPEEILGLRSEANKSLQFVGKYVPELDMEATELPLALDAAFSAWMRSTDPEKESGEEVTKIVGSAFGFFCIEKLGMRWAETRDEQGLEIGLVRSAPETRSFPFSSIRYRIEDQKSDFIYGLYVSLDRVIKDASHEPNQPPQPTPGLAPRRG